MLADTSIGKTNRRSAAAMQEPGPVAGEAAGKAGPAPSGRPVTGGAVRTSAAAIGAGAIGAGEISAGEPDTAPAGPGWTVGTGNPGPAVEGDAGGPGTRLGDRKSTRLNSSH